MNLKNYTSSAPASQTIAYIEAYLSDHPGVSAIAKEIKGGVTQSLMFQITEDGRKYTVRLAARVNDVLEYLWKDYVSNSIRPRKTKDEFLAQAERTAWKIQLDWVQVQMSLIKLKQAEFLQVFMGYLWNGGQTYYEYLKGGNFKQLPGTVVERE